ncbi:hypothetical protein NEMIN01_0893 [Nematocida minor]|uniref:uncharacterized protein n=1 Tax=Nematocida minor TaxID=1912983 RepID=UPI00221FB8F3|nr:uncharacterized protein NEMIN01_0893 [Nematocida minor]KAI5190194.1 hypothetical protein NEMIN01_0893 [Nematocida minor]
MSNQLIAYAVEGGADSIETAQMEEEGVVYYAAGAEFVIIDGNRAGCTCKGLTICQHILAVVKNEYPSDSTVLVDIINRVM